jgi:hypothetical protein
LSTDTLMDDLKDAVVDLLAPEYHRLNRPGERQLLPSIEVFLAAVAACFVVPYVKRMAEKAADASWAKLAEQAAKRRSYLELNATVPTNASEILGLRDVNNAEALAAATEAEDRFLSAHGIPPDVRSQVIVQLRITVESYRSPKD